MMGKFNRREFVKQTICGAMASGLTRMTPRIAMAEGPGNEKYFINIVLPGGMDTLFAYPFYNTLMGTMVDLRGPLAVTNDIRPIDSELGLHSNFDPIYYVHQQLQNLKIVSKVGFPAHSRSHYNAQANMSTLSADVLGTGWMRHIKQQYPERFTQYNLWGFNTGTALDLLPSGGPNPPITSLRRLSDFNYHNGMLSESEAQAVRSASLALLQVQRPDRPPLYDLVKDTLLAIPDQVEKMQQIATMAVSGDYGSGELADTLKDIGRVLLYKKATNDTADVIIQARYGGFDHHGRLLDKLPPELSSIATALRGLVYDLRVANLWNKTVILVTSEFSRTCRANGSDVDAGTDHGMAYNALLIGGGIRGGGNAIAGEHPTVSELRHERNYLLPLIDPRAIFGEIYSWMGLDRMRLLGSEYVQTNLHLFT